MHLGSEESGSLEAVRVHPKPEHMLKVYPLTEGYRV